MKSLLTLVVLVVGGAWVLKKVNQANGFMNPAAQKKGNNPANLGSNNVY